MAAHTASPDLIREAIRRTERRLLELSEGRPLTRQIAEAIKDETRILMKLQRAASERT